MDFLVFVFYITILFFFIVNVIVNIYTIEKRFNVKKAPGLLNLVTEITYKSKDV